MENAVDALKIAFAVFVFVIALSILFSNVSQIKKASDTILYYIDKTNFYDNLNSDELETETGGRVVSIDTIISNLYRITQESFEITIEKIGQDPLKFKLDPSSGMTKEKLYEKIEEFVVNNINEKGLYLETFSEVTYTGIYWKADDGSEVTKTPGIKTIYIRYTEITEE